MRYCRPNPTQTNMLFFYLKDPANRSDPLVRAEQKLQLQRFCWGSKDLHSRASQCLWHRSFRVNDIKLLRSVEDLSLASQKLSLNLRNFLPFLLQSAPQRALARADEASLQRHRLE